MGLIRLPLFTLFNSDLHDTGQCQVSGGLERLLLLQMTPMESFVSPVTLLDLLVHPHVSLCPRDSVCLLELQGFDQLICVSALSCCCIWVSESGFGFYGMTIMVVLPEVLVVPLGCTSQFCCKNFPSLQTTFPCVCSTVQVGKSTAWCCLDSAFPA